MAEADTKPPDLRERVRIIIHEADTPAGKFFDVSLILAILASVGVVMFITVPGIDKGWVETLNNIEWGFTILFTIEYALRLWSVDSPAKYARSFFGVIDLWRFCQRTSARFIQAPNTSWWFVRCGCCAFSEFLNSLSMFAGHGRS